MKTVRLSETHAYRIGQLTERLQRLHERAAAVMQEQTAILAQYGVSARQTIEIVTESGMYPIGTVLDTTTKAPLAIDEPTTENPALS